MTPETEPFDRSMAELYTCASHPRLMDRSWVDYRAKRNSFKNSYFGDPKMVSSGETPWYHMASTILRNYSSTRHQRWGEEVTVVLGGSLYLASE